MKRRIVHVLSLMLLVLVGLSSCQTGKQQDVLGGGEVIPSTSSERITFTFAAPKGLPTTYALHDAAEWAIKDNKILLYEFRVADKTYLKTHELTLTPAGDAKYTVTAQTSDFTGPKGDIYPNENRHFLFVANAKPITGLTRSNTIEQVMQQLIGAEQQSNASSNTILLEQKFIPMVGLAQTSSLGAPSTAIPVNGDANVTVDLIRAVARIDIQTTMGPNFLNPNLEKLVIKSATLKNTYSTTGVGEHKLLNIANKASGVTTFSQFPAGGIQPDVVPAGQQHGIPGKLQKAFYLYETPDNTVLTRAQVPAVEFTVTYGSDPTEYNVTVPFYQNGKAVDVKRNYLYTIILGPIDDIAQGATFSITTNEWNGPELMSRALNLVVPEAATGASLPSDFDAKSHTLSVAKAGSTTAIEFPFVSQFANGGTNFTATLKAAQDGTTPFWLNVSAQGKKVTIDSIQENTTGVERTAVVLVSDDAAPNAYSYHLLVKQAAN